jgi:Poly A polymerase head domain
VVTGVTTGLLQQLFVRADDGPAISGDLIGTRRVEGFRYDRPQDREPGRDDDFLGVTDNGVLDWIPLHGQRVTSALGIRAPLRLRAACCRCSTATEQKRFDEVRRRHDALWPGRDLVEDLVRAVWKRGYEFWFAGGAVRDVLADRVDAVNDLDCAGTIPAGEFIELAQEVLGGTQLEPHATSRPVIHFEDRSGASVIEYKPLEYRIHDVVASDNDLEFDAGTRDLTINTLLYDPVHHIVLDPTGLAAADLRERRLRPCIALDDPLRVLSVFLRVLKFVHRFAGAGWDVAPAASWTVGQAGTLRKGLGLVTADPNPVWLERNLLRVFYGRLDNPRDDPGLGRLRDAAAALGSTDAENLADALANAYG